MKQLRLATINGEVEIFHSIQGEGVSSGVPSVFIRTSECNLHCAWCDTDYTWNWENTPWKHQDDSSPNYTKYNKEKHQVLLDIEEVVQKVLHFNCSNIILTGGEPLLQQEALISLVQRLKLESSDFTFEVETNGTKQPVKALIDLIDQWNVSPKLANSQNSEKLRINSSSLKFFATSSQNTFFKFVVESDQDIQEIQALQKKFQLLSRYILLMPQGVTAEELSSRRLVLIQLCKDFGYRYSERLHIHIWGKKRGV